MEMSGPTSAPIYAFTYFWRILMFDLMP